SFTVIVAVCFTLLIFSFPEHHSSSSAALANGLTRTARARGSARLNERSSVEKLISARSRYHRSPVTLPPPVPSSGRFIPLKKSDLLRPSSAGGTNSDFPEGTP